MHVLLAEDERGIAVTLTEDLQYAGHQVRWEPTGSGALQAVRESVFDCLITDVRLPGCDGMELLKAAKARRPETEVVVITGYADTQGSLEANRALAQRRAQAVAQALRGLGGPLAGSVAVVAVGEPEGAADSEANSENRRVEVLVAPHGTYNKGP